MTKTAVTTGGRVIVKTCGMTAVMLLMSSCITAQTTLAHSNPDDTEVVQQSTQTSRTDALSRQQFVQNYESASNIKGEHLNIAYDAEQDASAAGAQVLSTVREMALDDREIIQGACWDYLNEAFDRAGVKRNTVFKGSYPNGAFVDTSRIQAGDWLYYVNHSYHDVEHSGLFVGWANEDDNKALILSYAGESRREPARYKIYDVSHTYNIMRPTH